MEEMLGRFQGDLGNISTEIRSLQEQSQSMSVKLRNRKAAEQKLGAFLDNLAIPSGLIEGIVQGDVDESYQVPSSLTSPESQPTRVGATVTSPAACGLHLCMLATCQSVHGPCPGYRAAVL